jgi:hypothetical protein
MSYISKDLFRLSILESLKSSYSKNFSLGLFCPASRTSKLKECHTTYELPLCERYTADLQILNATSDRQILTCSPLCPLL